MPGGAYEGRSNNEKFDIEALNKLNKKFGLLCPINVKDLRMTNYYGAELFEYGSI